MYRVSRFITTFALCLLTGTLMALVWANLAPDSYHDLVELRLLDHFLIGYPDPEATGLMSRTLTLEYLVNNLLMALFFLLVGKELWEAVVQPDGPLRGQAALVPVAAAAGGMILPVLLYLAIAATTRHAERVDLLAGWAVPVASDLVLAYVVGRLVFGRRHPALKLLMLVAILAEMTGLVLVDLFRPLQPGTALWLALPVLAPLLAWALFNRWPARLRTNGQTGHGWLRFCGRAGNLPWLLAGLASWYGMQQAGLHPALGFLPVIPAIPRADRSYGFFAEAEEYLNDQLNRLAHLLVLPVAAGLFFYGLISGGAELAAYEPATTVTFFALLLGKPLGVAACGMAAARLSGRGLPEGVSLRDLMLVGVIAGIGFTVPFLMANAALPGGLATEAAKLGIVASLLSAPLALALARLIGIGRWQRA